MMVGRNVWMGSDGVAGRDWEGVPAAGEADDRKGDGA
jgi:hypothetical protein